MSNKIVEDVYSGVINDVSKNVKYDFEEMGIEDIVLQELLSVGPRIGFIGWANDLLDMAA